MRGPPDFEILRGAGQLNIFSHCILYSRIDLS